MKALARIVTDLVGENALVVADVGAAYGLPSHLRVLEPAASLLFFEPHPERANELRAWHAANGAGRKIEVIEAALSGTGGKRRFHVTNVPTGSSLLKPGSEAGLQFVHESYFFPVTEKDVDTRRLDDVIRQVAVESIHHIKLDIQGGEFEVLRGLGDENGRKLMGVELEIGFPGGYVDQPGFGPIDELLRSWGLELFDLRLARTHRSKNDDAEYYPAIFGVPGDSPTLSKRLWEADGLYFRKLRLILESGTVPDLRRLLALYCAYGFYVEAYSALEQAEQAKFLDADEAGHLRRNVLAWHRAAQHCGAEAAWFRLTKFVSDRIWPRLRARLCGPRTARWIE